MTTRQRPAGRLDGRVAVVTGSTRGLGLATARALGRAGATVVVSGRSAAQVESAVDLLRTEGVDASGLACDVRTVADVAALRDHALERGRLDIWVNNAGVSGVYGPTATTPVDDFTRVVETNILGTFHGSRAALPVFLRQRSGDLVNVYGQGDTRGVALQNAYGSSKRWVRHFTETLQKETRGSGVRVHGINPGLMTTAFLRSVAAQPGYEGRLRALPAVVALWGEPPVVAAAPMVELVTSTRSRYVALTVPRLVARATRHLIDGRLLRDRRMAMQVATVDGRGGPLG